MREILIVPLGPGNESMLTLGAAEALKSAKALVLRTSIHEVKAYLDKQNIHYATMDEMYEKCADFDQLNRQIASTLWEWAEKLPITYAVADPVTDESVQALYESCPDDGNISALPGMTQASLYQSRALGKAKATRQMCALDAQTAVLNASEGLLITELNSAFLTGAVKLHLMDLYPEETDVLFFESDKAKGMTIPLYELDRQQKYDHTSAVFVPSVNWLHRSRFDMVDLEMLVKTLRGENGCPWDREQTHESMLSCLVEEAYEIRDAVEKEDDDALCKELGDLLFDVLFHCDIAADHASFTVKDVTTAAVTKMIHRHPHVFGDSSESNVGEIEQSWDKIKRQENGFETVSQSLEAVPHSLPALMRAQKVLERAARAGFKMPDAQEKLTALCAECSGENARFALPQLLLYACQLARMKGLRAEEMLMEATDTFISRFFLMENAIFRDGKRLEGLTLSEMDVYFNTGKNLAE